MQSSKAAAKFFRPWVQQKIHSLYDRAFCAKKICGAKALARLACQIRFFTFAPGKGESAQRQIPNIILLPLP